MAMNNIYNSTIRNIRKRFNSKMLVLHPFFFALYPVFNTLSNNIDTFPISSAIRSIIIVLLSAALLHVVACRFLGDPHRSGIIATFAVIFLFYLGSSFTLPAQVHILDVYLPRPIIVFGVWGLVTAVVSSRWVWQRVRPANITKYINVLSVIPLINPLRIILAFFIFLHRDPLYGWDNPIAQISDPVSAEVENTPDIYYIILDGYARQDVLLDIYQHDNSDFIHSLEKMGFYVAHASQSNYIQTGLSLGSTLSMEYLDFLDGVVSANRYPLSDLIRESRVRKILDLFNYTTINVESKYLLTDHDDADIYLPIGNPYLNSFEKLLLYTSSLKYIEDFGFINWDIYGYSSHRNWILKQFQALEQIPGIPGPKFVFIHIIAPHPPFVFDEIGMPLNPGWDYTIFDGSAYQGSKIEYLEGYRKQIQYINSLVLSTVGTILHGTESPPLIILQSDHGPGAFLSYSSIEMTCLYERTSILNAFYFPDQNYSSLYESITPVNTFRALFDNYFSASYGLLQDKSFYSSWSRPYDFIEIDAQNDNFCSNLKIP